MLLLPKNLASLAKLAGRMSRFAMASLRVTEHTEGYRIDVTDGKRLAIVTGPGRQDEPFEEVEKPAWQALIPAGDWERLLKQAGKVEARVVLAEDQAHWHLGDTSATTRNMEGRYPDVDRVAQEQASMFKVRVNAKLFAELLRVAAEFADDSGAVDVHFNGDRCVLVTTQNGTQRFQSAIMPMTPEK